MENHPPERAIQPLEPVNQRFELFRNDVTLEKSKKSIQMEEATHSRVFFPLEDVIMLLEELL